MKILIAVLRFYGYMWTALGTIAILLGIASIAGTWMEGGFSAVQELVNPLSVTTYLVTLPLAPAPGIGAIALTKYLKKKLYR